MMDAPSTVSGCVSFAVSICVGVFAWSLLPVSVRGCSMTFLLVFAFTPNALVPKGFITVNGLTS